MEIQGMLYFLIFCRVKGYRRAADLSRVSNNFATTTLVVGQSNYYDCSEASLKRCLGDMLDVATQSQEGQIPSYTPTEFRNVCREYGEAQSCLRSYCSKKEQAQLDGVTTLFEYLCHDGFDIYINNSACFLNKTLETQMQECLQTYAIRGKELTTSYGSAESKLEKLCRYTNDYVGCSGHKTRLTCGPESAELVVESARRVFDKVFSQTTFKCEISAASGLILSYMSLLISCILLLKNYF